MKCAADTPAIFASRGMQSGWAKARSMASLARSIRRLQSSTDRDIQSTLPRRGRIAAHPWLGASHARAEVHRDAVLRSDHDDEQDEAGAGEEHERHVVGD